MCRARVGIQRADYAQSPMLDPRVYRAALLPVLLALIVVAFSLENRPGPLRTTLTADAFDGGARRAPARRLAAAYPERPAGGAARHAARAARVAAELRGGPAGRARAAPRHQRAPRPTATASS